MRIDSHHHFWNYSQREYPWITPSMAPLRRDFGIAELRPHLEQCGVSGVVSVQARQSLEETRWLLETAAAAPEVLGVVGWVPLAADPSELGRELDALCENRSLKGVRHVVQDEPDDAFLRGAEFNRGVEMLAGYGLVYDILIYARQLPAAIEFADRHPNLPMVVDHIAKPTITGTAVDPTWESPFRELARREHVSCKFSGVVTEVRGEQWTIDTLDPYWQIALEAFGPERLMFGSDWPVCLLRSRYDQWVACVERLSAELSEAEQRMFWHDNACRVYGLESSATC